MDNLSTVLSTGRNKMIPESSRPRISEVDDNAGYTVNAQNASRDRGSNGLRRTYSADILNNRTIDEITNKTDSCGSMSKWTTSAVQVNPTLPQDERQEKRSAPKSDEQLSWQPHKDYRISKNVVDVYIRYAISSLLDAGLTAFLLTTGWCYSYSR
uniref:Uncharacterized protein n=1 Tax=Parascaris univalens TaxID=6257 RepID=A0A915BJL1_PARUN